MAIIKTVAELKLILPKLVSNLTTDSALPNFEAAEMKYLVPVIGLAQYEQLHTKYNAAEALTATETALLKHMQLFVAAHAFLDEMVINHVMWTDQGLRTITTQEMGKPVGWEFRALKEFFIDRVADAEEILLTYMWEKKSELELWTASEAYTRFTSLLIKTGTELMQYYRSLYQPMRTYYQLQPVVMDVQEQYLEAGIGKELLQYLKDQTEPTAPEKEALRLLKKALAFFTIKKACMHLPVRISDAGLTIQNAFGGDRDTEDAGRMAATDKNIEKLERECEKEGQNFLSKARYQLYVYKTNETPAPALLTAYEAGPLKGYVSPDKRTSGNESRKIFKLG